MRDRKSVIVIVCVCEREDERVCEFVCKYVSLLCKGKSSSLIFLESYFLGAIQSFGQTTSRLDEIDLIKFKGFFLG